MKRGKLGAAENGNNNKSTKICNAKKENYLLSLFKASDKTCMTA